MTRRRGQWIALALYSVLAAVVFLSTWVDPGGRWIGSPKDPQLFIWYLGWIPHQLSHGLNPLYTNYLSYPPGVNLMWNTSMIFPALVLWPVTAVFGPVVAYNLLITAGIALSAWCGFLAARRFVDGDLPCFLAGLVYGFSPGLIAQALGHPHVVVALYPPIALLLGDEILVRRRLHPALYGALAGLATALQLLTGEELLAVTLLIAALGAALLALMHRDAGAVEPSVRGQSRGCGAYRFHRSGRLPAGLPVLWTAARLWQRAGPRRLRQRPAGFLSALEPHPFHRQRHRERRVRRAAAAGVVRSRAGAGLATRRASAGLAS